MASTARCVNTLSISLFAMTCVVAASFLPRLLPLCHQSSPFGAFSMDEKGVDCVGNSFASRSQLWAEEAGTTNSCFDPSKKQEWYRKGVSYWEGVEASVNGVLGGYGHVSDKDVAASDGFLMEVLSNNPEARLSSRHLVALDCGAGVGRVTKNLLLRRFHEVDLVEPVCHFLEAAKDDLKSLSPSSSVFGRAANFYCEPLQDFTPEASRYDVIWVQWCIGHLTDQDLVDFFKRAKVGLKPHGIFFVKENTTKSGFVVDNVDSSVTRSDAHFRDLFQQAGLFLLNSKVQKGFPKELFTVRMYALTTQMRTNPVVQARGKTANWPRVIV